MRSICCLPNKPPFPDLDGIIARYDEGERLFHNILDVNPRKILSIGNDTLYCVHHYKLVEIIFEDQSNMIINFSLVLSPQKPGDGLIVSPEYPILNAYFMQTRWAEHIVFTVKPYPSCQATPLRTPPPPESHDDT
jgi:hypothetical protein